ncbi:MAG: hypothetical protein FJW20_13725 [Acidimicrobiia bacterium]|nr:hypothetical protein [Acidimicrobiia bacterium]
MKLTARDRRALMLLAAATVVALAFRFWPESAPEAVSPAMGSVPMAEKRLARLRQMAATVPVRTKQLEQVSAQLGEEEKGLLEAETAAQAQAQLVQILGRLGRAQSPAIDLRQVETGPIRRLGNFYGEAFVSVTFTCAIEQLVNLLADISAQPELIATHDMQVRAMDQKKKSLSVRLTVSGVLPGRLAPERSQGGMF